MVSLAGIFPSVLLQGRCMSCAPCLGCSFSMAGSSSFSMSHCWLQCHLREASWLKLSFASLTPVLFLPQLQCVKLTCSFNCFLFTLCLPYQTGDSWGQGLFVACIPRFQYKGRHTVG